MKRAAREYLMDRMRQASRPTFVASFPSAGGDVAGLELVLRELRQGARGVVLPPSARIEIIAPKGAPRVVAGKGGRRRGLRQHKLVVRMWSAPAPSMAPLPGFWHNHREPCGTPGCIGWGRRPGELLVS